MAIDHNTQALNYLDKKFFFVRLCFWRGKFVVEGEHSTIEKGGDKNRVSLGKARAAAVTKWLQVTGRRRSCKRQSACYSWRVGLILVGVSSSREIIVTTGLGDDVIALAF